MKDGSGGNLDKNKNVNVIFTLSRYIKYRYRYIIFISLIINKSVIILHSKHDLPGLLAD